MCQNGVEAVSLRQKVLDIFKRINQIPRCSGSEKTLSDWLVSFAKVCNLSVIQDEALNIIISVPATEGYENKPGLILQGHMDMVCVKDQNVTHDFKKDPIEMYEEDGWLMARGTTLGADNGIAIAIALAIATNESIVHPPLELLFTTDEERGLGGANTLSNDLLKGKNLLNLDSEDEGVFTIGCAGGRETHIELTLGFEDNVNNLPTFEIEIYKLSGGHSGIQIGQQKPNAIQLVSRILFRLVNDLVDFHLIGFNAGVAHNAIPTNAIVEFACTQELYAKNIIEDFFAIFEKEYRETEPDMILSYRKIETCDRYINRDISRKIAYLLMALPHGVLKMTQDSELVETSNNLAQACILDYKFRILLSQRSSITSQHEFITQKIEAIAKLAGAEVFNGSGYPAWQPDWHSKLLEKSILAYKKIFDKEPKIEVIHAGLECGVIGAKYPGMEMISFGPTIITPHTSQEKLKISDIAKIIQLLIEIFKSL